MENAPKDILRSPRLWMKTGSEDSFRLALKLTEHKRRFVVRFTGGCGYMSPVDADGFYQDFTTAFRGFRDLLIFGGTSMVNREDPRIVVPGITEVPIMIGRENPGAYLLGVVPRVEDLRFDARYGLVVSNNPDDEYVTIVHPNADEVLILQDNMDDGILVGKDESIWDVEFKECMRLIQQLRQAAGWGSLLVSYNGGATTEKEIIATAKKGWPVLLIEGSGRKSEEYATNPGFRKEFRNNVFSAPRDWKEIRKVLIEVGALDFDRERSRHDAR